LGIIVSCLGIIVSGFIVLAFWFGIVASGLGVLVHGYRIIVKNNCNCLLEFLPSADSLSIPNASNVG